MRGAFETFLLFFLGMTFVLLGFSMVDVTFSYNKARLLQETVISLIERHDRYDEDIDVLIHESKQNCSKCTYVVTPEDSKYKVDVNFDLNINLLNYKKVASISAYTQSLK